MTKVQYRLFALETSLNNSAYAGKQRFRRITPTYTLIYTRDEEPRGTEVDGENLHRLTAQDEEWLQACNREIILEEAAKAAPRTAETMSRILDELEAELDAKKQGGEEIGDDK